MNFTYTHTDDQAGALTCTCSYEPEHTTWNGAYARGEVTLLAVKIGSQEITELIRDACLKHIEECALGWFERSNRGLVGDLRAKSAVEGYYV